MRFWQLAQRAKKKTTLPYSEGHESIIEAVYSKFNEEKISHKASQQNRQDLHLNNNEMYQNEFEINNTAVNKDKQLEPITKKYEKSEVSKISRLSDENPDLNIMYDNIVMTPEELLEEKIDSNLETSTIAYQKESITDGNQAEIAPECLVVIDESYPELDETVKMMEGLGKIQIINHIDNPLLQILQYLSSLKHVASLHIFSKVSPGSLFLGGKDIFIESMNSQDSIILQSWGKYFSRQGIIYIYDSDFISTSIGRKAKESIEKALDVSVIIPDNKIGISIQPAEMNEAWGTDDSIEEDNDILSLLLNYQYSKSECFYSVNRISNISLDLEISSIKNPIIILKLQVSDGIIMFSNSKHINYLQRPQVGPKLVVKGETPRLIRLLKEIKLLTGNPKSVFIRATVFDVDNNILNDITIVTKSNENSELENNKFDVSILASKLLINRQSEKVYIIIESKNDIIEFASIPVLYFMTPGSQELLVFKRNDISDIKGEYVCSFLCIGYPICEINLTKDSVLNIESACKINRGLTINQTCTLIVDTSENYSPQLNEGEWCQVTVASKRNYAIAGDYININLMFAEPIFVTGKPRIVIQLEKQEQEAIYSGNSGVILSQTLNFQYIVKSTDTALNGISVKKIEFESAKLLFGLNSNGKPGIRVDQSVLSSKRYPSIKICDQKTRKINHCVINDNIFNNVQLNEYIDNHENGFQILPKVSLDELFSKSVARKFHLVIVSSWDKKFNENIHLIQYNSRIFADGGYFGINSWNEKNYKSIIIDKNSLFGFAIDVFEIDKEISLLTEAIIENILLEHSGHIIASNRFQYNKNSDFSDIKNLSELNNLYITLGLKPEIINKNEESIECCFNNLTNIKLSNYDNNQNSLNLKGEQSQHDVFREVVTQFKSLVLPEES